MFCLIDYLKLKTWNIWKKDNLDVGWHLTQKICRRTVKLGDMWPSCVPMVPLESNSSTRPLPFPSETLYTSNTTWNILWFFRVPHFCFKNDFPVKVRLGTPPRCAKTHQSQAAEELLAFAGCEEHLEALADHGAIEALVQLLQHGCPGAQKHAAGVAARSRGDVRGLVWGLTEVFLEMKVATWTSFFGVVPTWDDFKHHFWKKAWTFDVTWAGALYNLAFNDDNKARFSSRKSNANRWGWGASFEWTGSLPGVWIIWTRARKDSEWWMLVSKLFQQNPHPFFLKLRSIFHSSPNFRSPPLLLHLFFPWFFTLGPWHLRVFVAWLPGEDRRLRRHPGADGAAQLRQLGATAGGGRCLGEVGQGEGEQGEAGTLGLAHLLQKKDLFFQGNTEKRVG